MDPLGTVSLLKTALDALRGAVGLAGETKDFVRSFDRAADLEVKHGELVGKLVELQGNLLALQSNLYAIREEIEDYDRFKERADRYQLRKTEAGGFVYTLKPDADPSKPVHDICPDCYENRKTTVLQARGTLLTCNVCKVDFANLPSGPDVMVGPVRRSSRFDGFP